MSVSKIRFSSKCLHFNGKKRLDFHYFSLHNFTKAASNPKHLLNEINTKIYDHTKKRKKYNYVACVVRQQNSHCAASYELSPRVYVKTRTQKVDAFLVFFFLLQHVLVGQLKIHHVNNLFNRTTFLKPYTSRRAF